MGTEVGLVSAKGSRDSVPPDILRRQLTAGVAAFALTARTRSTETNCAGRLPGWANNLRVDLERMARELTARLQPWKGPRLTLEPEDVGHVADRTQVATRAIQATIDAVAQRGGGTVRLSRGDYVSGTLDLRSNVRLEVRKGARLLASLDLEDFPQRVASRPTVMDSNMGMNQSLIFAQGCQNIGLCGDGLIDGRGARQNFPGAETSGATPGRPFLIRALDCQRVHVRGIHLKDAACWMQNYLNCEDLLIEDITVENQANFNNDGVDIDGCRRVIVRNCFINSEDDGLCFKGTSQRPMEEVLVENCRLYSTCNALKFGTDSQGDFRRVLVRNVEVGGPSASMRSFKRRRAISGISWEVVDGGTVEDIVATGIRIVRAESPLFLRLGDRGRVRPEDKRPPPGNLRRIVFDGITGHDNGARGSYFIGIADKSIENVAIQDLKLEVSAHDTVPDENAIPEMRSDYPDAQMIRDVTPAYGLWTRHLNGLTLVRVTFTPDRADPRPAIKLTRSTYAC